MTPRILTPGRRNQDRGDRARAGRDGSEAHAPAHKEAAMTIWHPIIPDHADRRWPGVGATVLVTRRLVGNMRLVDIAEVVLHGGRRWFAVHPAALVDPLRFTTIVAWAELPEPYRGGKAR